MVKNADCMHVRAVWKLEFTNAAITLVEGVLAAPTNTMAVEATAIFTPLHCMTTDELLKDPTATGAENEKMTCIVNELIEIAERSAMAQHKKKQPQ